MTSASASSAKHLFSDSKNRLAERVNQNVSNVGSVARQIVRGSKSNEVSFCFVCFDSRKFLLDFLDIVSLALTDNTATTLHKIQLIRQHIRYHEAIYSSVDQLDYLQEQVTAMER